MFFCGQIDANFLVIFRKMEESEKKKKAGVCKRHFEAGKRYLQ